LREEYLSFVADTGWEEHVQVELLITWIIDNGLMPELLEHLKEIKEGEE
jgi:hypothetical protein